MNAVRQPLPATAVPRSADARRLGRLAIASLHAELACAPKPGLVTPLSRGSHTDMDAGTFLRSLFALRGYFVAIAHAGCSEVPFASLRTLGIAAEAAMLRATGGINTHRGAIFSLGLLVAQSARLRASGEGAPSGEAVCRGVAQWRSALLEAPLNPHSPGQRARRRHAVPGVREQAAAGYPLLHALALPTLQRVLDATQDAEAAQVETLMTLIAHTVDLNLLHRGGEAGLAFAQHQAHGFLTAGGVQQADWRERVAAIGDAFEQRRLSPGGSADLLACTWFLHLQAHA
ncbi:triphosphoribosyl-dephospho-CoA synthase MdcB [Stenotrophomonas sp. Ste96]|uniref:triphosphoribosyl-dephospho-CoA synthase MdcB n=1 Tax=Stenotrophomonas sp. Ste96 TaxID=2926029 RepID=UPI0021C95AD7|nr:triphosphoribosyl-dephospho-CoA synthase MdcB [Stenotrophomonas sp. Ste96]